MGIGFDEEKTDIMVDQGKVNRRKIRPGSKTQHLFVSDDVKSIINND
jgi:hypothetical protein